MCASIPQQSKQVGSGVCWCEWEGEVPEGSGGFRRVPEGSGGCAEGCGGFGCVPVEGSGGFWKVPEGFRSVPVH